MKKLLLLFHTVKYLRWEQIVYRFYYKLRKPEVMPLVKVINRSSCFIWRDNGYTEQSIFSKDTVKFLGKRGIITSSKDWNSIEKSKLWLYNLHYFDDLNAKGNVDRYKSHIFLIYKWIDENPPCKGNGWEPYPLSLRIVNWVKWYSRFSLDDEKILSSLCQQVEGLSKQLEFHILGNHLFANAKAMVFAGVFFDNDKMSSYLIKGLGILNRELKEQFLDDGGHFELSPMYHQILLIDLLELIDLAELSRNSKLLKYVPSWKNIASKALEWLSCLLHSDGEISFFNDAAIGIAPSPSYIYQYAASLGIEFEEDNKKGLKTLSESGYTRIEYDEHLVIFDHANIGPDYLPGHAHADSLSFEWSVAGQRVLVNSGTSLYGGSPERLRQRQTAAHNTVVINDENSSEVWAGFRVAKRAKTSHFNASVTLESIEVNAQHDGYMRLKNGVLHKRSLRVSDNSLLVTDVLQGKYKSAYSSFHLHPDIEIANIDAGFLILVLPSLLRISLKSSSPIDIVESTWHPRFGSSIPNKKVLLKFNSNVVSVQFSILSDDS